jgi:hypothetical protein
MIGREARIARAMIMKTLTVEPNSELDALLDSIDQEPAVLIRRGVRYRIQREGDDPFANYDPERACAAMHAMAGMLKGIDVPKFLEEIKANREQGVRGQSAR